MRHVRDRIVAIYTHMMAILPTHTANTSPGYVVRTMWGARCALRHITGTSLQSDLVASGLAPEASAGGITLRTRDVRGSSL